MQLLVDWEFFPPRLCKVDSVKAVGHLCRVSPDVKPVIYLVSAHPSSVTQKLNGDDSYWNRTVEKAEVTAISVSLTSGQQGALSVATALAQTDWAQFTVERLGI
jgi:hypothetical protein